MGFIVTRESKHGKRIEKIDGTSLADVVNKDENRNKIRDRKIKIGFEIKTKPEARLVRTR